MRRSIKANQMHTRTLGTRAWRAAALVMACASAACQDGPNQTYVPPPANAGWNDGNPYGIDSGVVAGNATTATAPFALPDGGPISSNGNNANEICTQQQIAALNPIIATAPLAPPNTAGNLNMAGVFPDGGVSWQGLTADQAQAINCQGTVENDVFGGGSDYLDVTWDNGSVLAEYYVPTQKIGLIFISAPYEGVMTVCSQPQSGACPAMDGNTIYTIPMDGTTAITAVSYANGSQSTMTLNLDWLDAANGVPTAVAIFDTLYRAVMATDFPTYPPEPANFTCNQTGGCIIGLFTSSGTGYFYIPALGWAIESGLYYSPVSANAMQNMFFYFAQVMPFSPASPVLKMDAVGPVTLPLQLAQAPTPPCTLSMGMNYGDFTTNCVQVSANASANQTSEYELYSQVTHDQETISFDISGVDVSFVDTRLNLQTNPVVLDPPLNGGCPGNPGDPNCPQPVDTAYYMNIDQSTLGNIANDWVYDSNGNPILHDLHGAGAMYDDYRAIALNDLEGELCNNGYASGSQCTAWSTNPVTTQIANCVAPRDAATGLLTVDPTTFAGTNCTGLETLVSADVTTSDDPVNVGPIASQINPDYTLGMKMGHQSSSFCVDAMSLNQIAKLSYTLTCANGAAQACAPLPAPDVYTQVCPGGTGNCIAPQLTSPQATPFQCPATSCDPTQGACPAGVFTCTTQVGTNPTPLAVADLNLIGATSIGAYLQNPTNANPPVPAPAGTEVVLVLPWDCTAGDILPTSHDLVTGTLGGGSVNNLPIDIRDNRFYFKEYSLALIQTLEAANTDGSLSAPVASWGAPALGSAMPISPNDLYFDSNGDGQFEAFEYVDRRFVCPDGADDCAPPGAIADGGWSCPAGTCVIGSFHCSSNTCNPMETAQPPLDINFTANVRDGIMDAYDFGRYLYRGEAALYQTIQPPTAALAKASNALISNIFGSPMLAAFGGPIPDGYFSDLTGEIINTTSDYPGVFNPTALSLSYSQSASSPLSILQTQPSMDPTSLSVNTGTYALVGYPLNGSQASALVPWYPYQPGNGFDTAQFGNSQLDSFVETASIDFTGITTTAFVDYNIVNPDGTVDPTVQTTTAGVNGVEALSVESENFLGDVFMCYEPTANPPLLAVRMYTPTLAVLNWLNSAPTSYSDCGIVVRWSPYDNYVTLIESTTYGVRLQVTQGGGLGRIVGATAYVPNLPFEE